MISTTEAKEIVRSNQQDWGVEEIAIENAVGRILREDIYADRDFPPFNRVTMDGIAIMFSDFESGIREFEIQDIQTAGEKAKTISQSGQAIEIMTGAILSHNADLNVRYEDLEIYEGAGKKIAKVNLSETEIWKNVHKKGLDRKAGDLLLEKGRNITSADIAAFATVGKSQVTVSKLPKIAIISTGDELVRVSESPEPHQIRMSNSICIQSKLNELNLDNDLFHLLDDYDSLLLKIEKILKEYDAIILSGGVSKGKADYIPDVLDALGVERLFHRVAQRPGKPLWFGKSPSGKCVFALPGNPVSTFMCFYVYFLPWLKASLQVQSTNSIKAMLLSDCSFVPRLTYYMQVATAISNTGQITASPEIGGGSGDLSNLLETHAFIELPADQEKFKSGESYEIYPFRTF